MILELSLALHCIYFVLIILGDSISPFHEGPQGTTGIQCHFIPYKQCNTEDSF